MYFYIFRLRGSRAVNFTKYLKKLFPEYLCFRYNIDKMTEIEINQSCYRYNNYLDYKRYPIDKLRDCFRKNPIIFFIVPDTIKCDLFTLFELQGADPKHSYNHEIREFFVKIPDVWSSIQSNKKYRNVDMEVYPVIRRFTSKNRSKYHKLEEINEKIHKKLEKIQTYNGINNR